MSDSNNLIDFSVSDRCDWYEINDTVMGGVSRSGIRRTDRGTGVFAGELSLENNGGFASVRTLLGRTDLSSHAGLEIRVRGDGRSYQLRIRTNDRFNGIAYRSEFETTDGEWTTVRIRFSEFLPTFRGRTPSDAPPLDTTSIHQLGFMLADKHPGLFSLEIDWIRTWGSPNRD
jgi:monofunctional biosynthetic peptidoglycan transglycosylase